MTFDEGDHTPTSPDLPTPDPGVPNLAGVDTRAGYVTLAGRPNAGKSTLLNRLVGERLSIVTPKAQTTWQRITGIRTSEAVQMIFLDTPGLLEPRDRLQTSMLHAAHEALREADVVVLVLDATRDVPSQDERILLDALGEASAPTLICINKIDVSTESRIDTLEAWAGDVLRAPVLRVSALEGTGVDELTEALADTLPASPFLYPRDHLATEPVRFFVAELIRETVFQQFRQEVPYSVICRVEEFREAEDPIYIHAGIFVERNSQKGILVGKKGSSIKALGRAARKKIEAFLERSVYLDLWVKVLPDWRRRKGDLRRFGFRAPEEDEADIPS